MKPPKIKFNLELTIDGNPVATYGQIAERLEELAQEFRCAEDIDRTVKPTDVGEDGGVIRHGKGNDRITIGSWGFSTGAFDWHNQ